MAKYIDIEPLRKQIVEFKTAVKQFAKSSSFLKAYISGIDAVMEAIDKLPITDVQEVVRCKDCIYRKSSEFCECREPDFYCADGARMEEFEE